MAIVTRDGTTVAMLTDRSDGSVLVRLHGDREVVLREPTAREYAEARVAMREADRLIAEKCPEPAAPVIPDGTTDVEASRIAAEYQRQVRDWVRDRLDLMRDPDHGPYAATLIGIVNRLSGRDCVLDDFTAEVFNVTTCAALLEVWETPLGGPAVPAAIPTPDAPAVTAVPPDATEKPAPDSTASAPS